MNWFFKISMHSKDFEIDVGYISPYGIFTKFDHHAKAGECERAEV